MKNNFFTKLYKTFYLSKIENILMEYFNRDKDKVTNNQLILVQCVEDLYYYSLFGLIIKSIKETDNIKVEQFVQRSLTLGSTSDIASFFKSILLNNRFRDRKWIKLYSSYCDSMAYKYEGSSSLYFDIKAWREAFIIYKSIKTKEELLDLVIDNIKVGDLIYDSYLRFKPAPTVNINDFYLCIVIWQTIRNISITKKYFDKNTPSILLTSYSTYIQHGISVRVAIEYNTKVYSFGNYQNFTKQLTKDNYYHTSNFKNYRDNFKKLNNRENKLLKAKKAIEDKLNGNIDISIAYMKKSAYIVSDEYLPDVKNTIVILLHDFFDSPHVYGDMVFNDFLEWVEFTITLLEKLNIPFYLKPHPNQIGDSENVIKMLKSKYPNINFLSTKITNRQLVDGGIKLGISVYGTVGHELAYMGVPVILCGENPHSSYNFCYEAKSRDEYIYLIKNYKNLKLPYDYKELIESFYYMHNLNISDNEKLLIGDLISLFQYNHSDYIEFEHYITLLNNIRNNKKLKSIVEVL